jgi:hypothetical protein
MILRQLLPAGAVLLLGQIPAREGGDTVQILGGLLRRGLGLGERKAVRVLRA